MDFDYLNYRNLVLMDLIKRTRKRQQDLLKSQELYQDPAGLISYQVKLFEYERVIREAEWELSIIAKQ